METLENEAASLQKKQYTYDDLESMPEETRYEIMDGALIEVTSPIPRHQAFDPANNAIQVFTLQNGVYVLYSVASNTSSVNSFVLKGFEVVLENIIPPEYND